MCSFKALISLTSWNCALRVVARSARRDFTSSRSSRIARRASSSAKAWAEKLDFTLDQAYQNRKDMMGIWRETDAVCTAFEKRWEEERKKDE